MRNYIIIGGSAGIGQELVSLLEIQGANIIATYNNNTVEDRPNVRYLEFNATTDVLNMDDFPEEIHGLAYCPGDRKPRTEKHL